jgi:hypothetical protein
MKRPPYPVSALRVHGFPVMALAAAATLLVPNSVRANGTSTPKYRMDLVVMSGDRAGGVRIQPNGHLEIGSLNDNGQLVFTAANAAGGHALIQYDARGWRWWERFSQIAAGNGVAPTGKWPEDLAIWGPVSMNAQGDCVFAPTDTESFARYWNTNSLGTFRWDSKAQQVVPVAVTGMPAVPGLSFAAGGGPSPSINSRGEIALVGQFKNAGGNTRSGVLYVGTNGRMTAVAVPDQPLSDGRKIASAGYPSLNDWGTVAFLARASGETRDSAYVWQQGTITRIASPRSIRIQSTSDTPTEAGFDAITGVRVTRTPGQVLVGARLPGSRYAGLYCYRFAGRALIPVAVPGQAMPDGGRFQSLLDPQQGLSGVSDANQSGQFVFLAKITEAGATRTAAYLVDANGKPSLILKSGMMTEIGPVVDVGLAARLLSSSGSSGIGLNSKGQVALTMKIGDVPNMIVLLTPTAETR